MKTIDPIQELGADLFPPSSASVPAITSCRPQLSSKRRRLLLGFGIGLLLALPPVAPAADKPRPAADNKDTVPQGGDNYYPEWRKESGIPPTAQDWPGWTSKYYGQRPDQLSDEQRKIAKVEIDADLSYDGVINPMDPSDHGAFKRTPPGLVVGVGELTKCVIRVIPYRLDFHGEAVISLEVQGINRADKSGDFKSFAEEVANTSRVRIWRDPSKKILFLDSHDPQKRRIEWKFDAGRLAPGGAITGANLPFQTYPRVVYIEGVSPHGPFLGDTRILLSCENNGGDGTPGGVFKRFRTTWNHFLVTVNTKPMEKEYVVSESLQDIWITPGHRNAAWEPK